MKNDVMVEFPPEKGQPTMFFVWDAVEFRIFIMLIHSINFFSALIPARPFSNEATTTSYASTKNSVVQILH